MAAVETFQEREVEGFEVAVNTFIVLVVTQEETLVLVEIEMSERRRKKR